MYTTFAWILCICCRAWCHGDSQSCIPQCWIKTRDIFSSRSSDKRRTVRLPRRQHHGRPAYVWTDSFTSQTVGIITVLSVRLRTQSMSWIVTWPWENQLQRCAGKQAVKHCANFTATWRGMRRTECCFSSFSFVKFCAMVDATSSFPVL